MSERQPLDTSTFEALKKLLRQKKKTYKQLAEFLEISEAMVKKFMRSGRLEWSRLLRICEFLQVDIVDLIELARKEVKVPVRFTKKQEELFASNIGYFVFYNQLQNGLEPDQIAREHGISKKSVNTYLNRLEEARLIKIDEKGHPLVLAKGLFSSWDDRGPIGRIYARFLIDSLADRAKESLETNTPLFLDTGSRVLSERAFAQFQSEYMELVTRYRTISTQKDSLESGKTVTFLMIADFWRDDFFDHIPEL